MFKDIRRRIVSANVGNHKKTGKTGKETARLGKGDGSGELIADNAQDPRSMWVYQDTNEGRKYFPAQLAPGCDIPFEDNPAFEGFPVQIGYPPGSNILSIFGQYGLEAGSATGGPTLIEQKIINASYVSESNMVPMRLDAWKVDGVYGTEVHVAPAWYFEPGTGDVKYFGGDTIDLSATIGALGTGEHQLVLVVLDTDTGDLALVEGTAAVGTDKDAFGPVDIDALVYASQDYLPCGAVHLYETQTTITESDMYRGESDPRVLFTIGATRLRVSTANVSNPPTDAELDAAFGTPATVRAGWTTVLNDNGAGTNEYLVWSDGSNWFYAQGTKAT